MKSEIIAKQEILAFLENIDTDLSNFIENRIQKGVMSDKKWSCLSKELEHRRCWEVLPCTKMNCPARDLETYQCWLMAGTLCGGKAQGAFAEKLTKEQASHYETWAA